MAHELPAKAKLLISSAMPQSMQMARIRRPARAIEPGPDSGSPSRSPGYLEMPDVSGPLSQEPMSLRSTTIKLIGSGPSTAWAALVTLWNRIGHSVDTASVYPSGHSVTSRKQSGHGWEIPCP